MIRIFKVFSIAVLAFSFSSFSHSGEVQIARLFNGPSLEFRSGGLVLPKGDQRVLYSTAEQDRPRLGLYGARLGTGASQLLYGGGQSRSVGVSAISPNGEIALAVQSITMAFRPVTFRLLIKTDGSSSQSLPRLGTALAYRVQRIQFSQDSKKMLMSVRDVVNDGSFLGGSSEDLSIYVLELDQIFAGTSEEVLSPINALTDISLPAFGGQDEYFIYRDNVSSNLKSTNLSGEVTNTLSDIEVRQFRTEPNSNSVVYTNSDNSALYQADVRTGDFSQIALVSSPDVAIGLIRYLDAQTVIYDERSDAGTIASIYKLDLASGNSEQLLGFPQIAGSTFSDLSYIFSRELTSIVFKFTEVNSTLGERSLLSLIDLSTGGVEHFTADFVPYGRNIKERAISPNGSLTAFVVDKDIAGVNELYTYSSESKEILKAHDDYSVGQEVIVDSRFPSVSVSADEETVVYRARQDSLTSYEIYASNVITGSNLRLNSPLAATESVFDFKLSPGGKFAVWIDINGNLKARSLLDPDSDVLCFPIVVDANVASAICL